MPITLTGRDFDVDDDAYAEIVRKVIAEEIGTGKGANFVIKRSFTADITDYARAAALAFFRRLLERGAGAYWTFIVHTGDRTFVGATPERHVSLRDGTAVMNPISGTYRYPASGPTLPGVMAFLADRKESDELYMVVDEELKMMARICAAGGRVVGPYLKEMARLAHTEYFIEGRSDRDPRDILRETMFAPDRDRQPLGERLPSHRPLRARRAAATTAGSWPSSVATTTAAHPGLRDPDPHRRHRQPTAPCVSASAPHWCATPTRSPRWPRPGPRPPGCSPPSQGRGPARFAEHPQVRAALARRNATIARFWLADDRAGHPAVTDLAGRKVLVVDAEDTFTSMLDHQLRSMGLVSHRAAVRRAYAFDGYDLVVMGPGPGDPRDSDHPKIARLRGGLGTLLGAAAPFLAVCLSHQVLSLETRPRRCRAGTCPTRVCSTRSTCSAGANASASTTPSPPAPEDKVEYDRLGVVAVSRDVDTGEVHGLCGPYFASVQFHAESVLTQDGIRIMSERISGVLNR